MHKLLVKSCCHSWSWNHELKATKFNYWCQGPGLGRPGLSYATNGIIFAEQGDDLLIIKTVVDSLVTSSTHCLISCIVAQFKLNQAHMQRNATQHDTFCILHVYIRVCMCTKDWWCIKSTFASMRHVHYNLHKHACISGTNMQNIEGESWYLVKSASRGSGLT